LVFSMSLLAILSFASLTQGWMIVKVRLHEAALLAVVVVALFRPGFIMDQFYPAFKPLDLGKFVAGEVTAEPGYNIRIHVVRETDYGDRFKMFRIATPELGAAGTHGLYGVKIEPTDDGRYAVADLQFLGLAEQAGLELGDYVTDVDVEQVGLPPKELVYPVALALLALVIAMQLIRWRRVRAAEPVAAGASR
ncbi:MAG: DUF3394 domain-containing protein, partial [Alphaproteobacteria bacterium]